MKVYFVGAGPGDPGLLTVRALELLRACDCLVYDALVAPQILALASPQAEKINVGKRGSRHTLEQAEINRLLAAKAQEGIGAPNSFAALTAQTSLPSFAFNATILPYAFK